MRSLALILFVCPLVLHAHGSDHLDRATGFDDCPLQPPREEDGGSLPNWWTDSEIYAWQQICAGKVADMSFAPQGVDDGLSCQAQKEGEEWGTNRLLSSRFLMQVSSTTPWTDIPAKRSIVIRCARIADELNLEDARIAPSLWLENTRFDRDVDLSSARVSGNFSLFDSVVSGALLLRSTRIDDNLFLQRGIFGQMLAEGMTVGGSLAMGTGFYPMGADISRAKIGGSVNVEGSDFEGEFDGTGIEVSQSVFLRGGARFAEVDLTRAKIRGNLQIQGSTFTSDVDLTEAKIDDALMLRRAGFETRWEYPSTLDLRNAEVGALQATLPYTNLEGAVHSWRRVDAGGVYEPLPVDLTNFTYERLGTYGEVPHDDLSRVRVERLILWTEQSRTAWGGDDGYAPQPYMQLANVLRRMGAEAAADKVDYARMVHRMGTRENWWQVGLDFLSRYIVGFGIHPARALWWFLGLVGLGVIISYRVPAFSETGTATRFWYSLNNALPLVPLSKDLEELEGQEPGWVANFFTFQKIAGFALATVLVGALTLLGG